MKKVSIIVPVYNVGNYLRKCLKSLVNQTLKDIEIIVINGESIDNSLQIIEEFQSLYGEKIKVVTIKNEGAGNARNVGLNYVTGEYIGFVDGDDCVQEDMFEKMYQEAVFKQADIVCCNYYRVKNDTRFDFKQFGNQNILKEGNFDKTIYQSHLLLDEVPYLWNKIFKTEMIKNNKIQFCKELRIYEDLVFTYEAFAHANKISKIDEGLYLYTVSRNESLTHRLTEKRFDIFKAIENLNEYYKKINHYDEMKDAILYVFLKHIYVILEKRTYRKEKKLKIKYLKEVFQYLDKNFLNWKENAYFDLQEKNRRFYTSQIYWKLCIYLGIPIIQLNEKLAKLIHLIFQKKYGHIFWKHTKKPLKDIVFIFSQQGNNLSGNMFYLVKELANNPIYSNFKIYIGYSDNNKNKFEKLLENYQLLNQVKLVKNKTTIFAKILAKSKYVFTDSSMPAYYIKRENQVLFNTWHGTPLKTLGKSTENDFYDIANVQKNFVMSDYLLYPSEYMMNIMIEDYMLKGIAKNKIMLCGYPRNEIFLRNDRDTIREKMNLSDKTLIAYMPTWRGDLRDINVNNQLQIAEKHIEEISKGLKENQILYVNMHPFIGNRLDIKRYKNVRTFPKNYETYDFLSLCDILITDYSSVLFDFAITKKKILLFTYDEEEYFRNRGVYLPLSELPFPKLKTTNELIQAINSPIRYDASDFLKKFCQYERKDISKQICEKIILSKDNNLIIRDMLQSEKENVLLYEGDFEPNARTENFLNMINQTKSFQYNYYVSYITKKLKPNKSIFKKVISKINFYGQLGNNSNLSKIDILLEKILIKSKKMYTIFSKKYQKLHKTELKRIFGNISFKACIIFGKIEGIKIYQLHELPCKKILWIHGKKDFNKNVHPKIYASFDYIVVTNQENYDMVEEYCKENKNIKLVDSINGLEDFNSLIE